ncbi:MAG: hypothetical protein J6A16_09665 [Oscillospiraceae bacterium]|nr:hypothetical protein [Oscillospiraceae bacterium]
MKHGKNPTRKQMLLIKAAGLQPLKWLVCKDTTDTLELTHRITGSKRVIRKEWLK